MFAIHPDLRFKRIHPAAKLPSYGREGDAGLDVFALSDIAIQPGEQVCINTGLACEVPRGHEMVVRGRGGKTNEGVWAFHGTIDSNFRDEIKIIMVNHSQKVIEIKEGKAFVQVVCKPVPTWNPIWADELSPSNRDGMFGSSDAIREEAEKLFRRGTWTYLNPHARPFGCRVAFLDAEAVKNPAFIGSLPFMERHLVNNPQYFNHYLVVRTGQEDGLSNSPRMFVASPEVLATCFVEEK